MTLVQKGHLALVHSVELNYIYLYIACTGQCGWAVSGAKGCEWTNDICPTKKPFKCYSCNPKDVDDVIESLDLKKDFSLVQTTEKIIKDKYGLELIRPDFVYFKDRENENN